jgi:hypothetical protein
MQSPGQIEVLEAEKTGCGVLLMITIEVAYLEAEHPADEVAVSNTLYVPSAEYKCDGDASNDVLPSPKSHEYATAPVVVLLKLTVILSHARIVDEVKFTAGLAFTFTVIVVSSEQFAVETFKLTL